MHHAVAAARAEAEVHAQAREADAKAHAKRAEASAAEIESLREEATIANLAAQIASEHKERELGNAHAVRNPNPKPSPSPSPYLLTR